MNAQEYNKESAFIDDLRQIRKSKGITQAMLAEKAGLTQQQVSMMESGVQQPRLTTLIKYCDAIGVCLAIKDAIAE